MRRGSKGLNRKGGGHKTGITPVKVKSHRGNKGLCWKKIYLVEVISVFLQNYKLEP